MKKETLNNNVQEASAIIVGGSLSGLMTGIALAREGVQVTILEKADEDRGAGAGLQVDGGIFDRSKTARLLRKLASGGKKSVQLWSTIESNLREEANTYPNTKLRYQTRVKTVDQNEDSAWVVTDKGETFHSDIVIGADGHRSLVREHVAPDNPDAIFSGYIVWFAAVDEDELPKEDRPGYRGPQVTMLNSIGGFLFGSIFNKNDGTGRRIGSTWYDNTRNDLLRRLGCLEGNTVHHSIKGTDISEEDLQDLAEQATEKWPDPWLSVTLHAIQTRNLTGIPIKEYVPDNLVRGRIALIGDAAHVPAPITASGFNESLQDAVELGKCLAKEGVDEDAAIEALQKYEAVRLHKVQQVVESGKGFSANFGRP